jgi:metal-responsive CopG/Arc/MetJ family transcriptional regulator
LKKVGFQIPEELHQRLKEFLIVQTKGAVTQSEFVTEAIEALLAKNEKRSKSKDTK